MVCHTFLDMPYALIAYNKELGEIRVKPVPNNNVFGVLKLSKDKNGNDKSRLMSFKGCLARWNLDLKGKKFEAEYDQCLEVVRVYLGKEIRQ
jgi:hypothetical protein